MAAFRPLVITNTRNLIMLLKKCRGNYRLSFHSKIYGEYAVNKGSRNNDTEFVLAFVLALTPTCLSKFPVQFYLCRNGTFVSE
nr:hypothetical protein [Coptotermes formosanus]